METSLPNPMDSPTEYITCMGKIHKVFPRKCVKVSIAVLGLVLSLYAVFEIVGLFISNENILVKIYSFLSFFPVVIAAISFFVSSILRKRMRKIDRFFASVSIICLGLVILHIGSVIVIRTIINFVNLSRMTKSDYESLDPQFQDQISFEDLKKFGFFLAILFFVVMCCLCTCCCFPCLGASVMNCAHTYRSFITEGGAMTSLGGGEGNYNRLLEDDDFEKFENEMEGVGVVEGIRGNIDTTGVQQQQERQVNKEDENLKEDGINIPNNDSQGGISFGGNENSNDNGTFKLEDDDDDDDEV